MDHCVCSQNAHSSIENINVCYEFVTSDHLPISIRLELDYLPSALIETPVKVSVQNWSSLGHTCKEMYSFYCNEFFNDISYCNNPVFSCTDDNCKLDSHFAQIESLYNDIV